MNDLSDINQKAEHEDHMQKCDAAYFQKVLEFCAGCNCAECAAIYREALVEAVAQMLRLEQENRCRRVTLGGKDFG